MHLFCLEALEVVLRLVHSVYTLIYLFIYQSIVSMFSLYKV